MSDSLLKFPEFSPVQKLRSRKLHQAKWQNTALIFYAGEFNEVLRIHIVSWMQSKVQNTYSVTNARQITNHSLLVSWEDTLPDVVTSANQQEYEGKREGEGVRGKERMDGRSNT